MFHVISDAASKTGFKSEQTSHGVCCWRINELNPEVVFTYWTGNTMMFALLVLPHKQRNCLFWSTEKSQDYKCFKLLDNNVDIISFGAAKKI